MPIDMRRRAATNLGSVTGESSDGVAVAVGKLVLTSEVDGAPDFQACASAAPAPDTYTLRLRRKRRSAELKTVRSTDPGRMTVLFDEPY